MSTFDNKMALAVIFDEALAEIEASVNDGVYEGELEWDPEIEGTDPEQAMMFLRSLGFESDLVEYTGRGAAISWSVVWP